MAGVLISEWASDPEPGQECGGEWTLTGRRNREVREIQTRQEWAQLRMEQWHRGRGHYILNVLFHFLIQKSETTTTKMLGTAKAGQWAHGVL